LHLNQEPTSFVVDGKPIQGSLAISQYLFQSAGFDHILGKTEQDKQMVFSWGLDSRKKYKEGFLKERNTTIQVILF
jgi:hypothetical protein